MTVCATQEALITYRYLRWMLVVLPVLLFVVTVATSVQQGRLEPSISAYYGGPVRDVLVGTLIAIAVCLVVYRGRGLEDYTLNGAGFYAVFVALVPTGFGEQLDELRESPTPDSLDPADHVWMLRIVLTAVLALCVPFFVRELRAGTIRELYNRPAGLPPGLLATRGFLILTMLTLVAFTALAMVQLWSGPAGQVRLQGLSIFSFQLRIHDLAAVLMILSLLVAVLTKTGLLHGAADVATGERWSYGVIAVLMGPGVLAVWPIAASWAPGHVVIVLEWWEVALFAVFWFKENRRLTRRDTGHPPAT